MRPASADRARRHMEAIRSLTISIGPRLDVVRAAEALVLCLVGKTPVRCGVPYGGVGGLRDLLGA